MNGMFLISFQSARGKSFTLFMNPWRALYSDPFWASDFRCFDIFLAPKMNRNKTTHILHICRTTCHFFYQNKHPTTENKETKTSAQSYGYTKNKMKRSQPYLRAKWKNLPDFSFLTLFPDFSSSFSDFWQIFRCQRGHSSPLTPPPPVVHAAAAGTWYVSQRRCC